MVYAKGSTEKEVIKKIQEALNLKVDGVFGPKTEDAVKDFQRDNLIVADGIVGRETAELLGILDTDLSSNFCSYGSLHVEKFYMKPSEYIEGKNENIEYLFLHHTGGWNNPYDTIKGWENDSRGRVATEFVIGGKNIKTGDDQYDGRVLQAFPYGNIAYHLGNVGSKHMINASTGIEVCNFGYLVNGKTWSGQIVKNEDVCSLSEQFRGIKTWHKYTDKQLYSLKKLILFIADRDGINVHAGVRKWLDEGGVDKAFAFNEEAFNGKVKGLLFHCNVRKDKYDMFPQDELCDMIRSL